MMLWRVLSQLLLLLGVRGRGRGKRGEKREEKEGEEKKRRGGDTRKIEMVRGEWNNTVMGPT
jgi:hypothetical protein